MPPHHRSIGFCFVDLNWKCQSFTHSCELLAPSQIARILLMRLNGAPEPLTAAKNIWAFSSLLIVIEMRWAWNYAWSEIECEGWMCLLPRLWIAIKRPLVPPQSPHTVLAEHLLREWSVIIKGTNLLRSWASRLQSGPHKNFKWLKFIMQTLLTFLLF